ncbi:MAG TPA: CHAD domain-containing protein, partial [Vicinamibacterales bacterium]|nr:CHAD domain-containing protein [Vicinamibacterales bacterium]
SRRLRRVTQRFGTVRELDVLLVLIDELHLSWPHHGDALARVAVVVAKDRDEARERLARQLPIGELRRLIGKLGRIAADLAKHEESGVKKAEGRGWLWAIDARIVRRASQVRLTMHDAGSVYVPERLHAVRIAVKKLRYACELPAEIMAARTTAELRVLKRSQEVLGRMHDLQVLIDRVRQVQATLTPPNIAVWRGLDRLVSALDDDCRRLHARYMRSRPPLEAIVDRLSARNQSPARAQSGRAAG